jgi:hypothetical protein
MIRFFCPLCHFTLRAPEEKVGTVVTCPRCQEMSVVPSSGSASARTGSAGLAPSTATSSGPERLRHGVGSIRGRAGAMVWRLESWRYLVALVVGVGALSLLLAILAPALRLSEASVVTVRQAVIIVMPVCLLILFILLHGQGTSCPACGKWWAKVEGETECLGREQFQKAGVPWVRARRRTTYACKHCRHTWSATYTDEYQGAVSRRPNSAKE